ncbi:hypothetical protein YM304_18410 [Ilumatobacter coccineus YM16-304]|uniref:Uncharacterized protein n=1 Tax=Ilumatobacter coccineus (strain NBRC 103263 / KCTC 29153 / YM16-304) TaxID=1313172 RepID=A0A6C7EAK3_ILUCY|nr:hypothetical protein YM304_18410 [Ilumatobacter coccineus YM16-304]
MRSGVSLGDWRRGDFVAEAWSWCDTFTPPSPDQPSKLMTLLPERCHQLWREPGYFHPGWA